MPSVPSKIDVTIARLRLLLAEVSARESGLDGQCRTFEEQRDKLILFAIYGDTTFDSVLSMLADVQERLDDVQRTLQVLHVIRRRSEVELEQLQITKGIDEARTLLAKLQAQQELLVEGEAPPSRQAIQAEIQRLQALIAEASERAARTIETQSAGIANQRTSIAS